MRAEVAQAVRAAGMHRVRTPGALLAAPLALIREPGLRILAHDRTNLAELALLDELLGVLRGHMADIGVGYHEQQALVLGQLHQLVRLLGRQAQRLVACNVNARLEERLRDRIVRIVRRNDDDVIDAVLARGFLLGHFLIGLVAALRVHAELFARLQAVFMIPRKAARGKDGLPVQIDCLPVRIADECALTAAYHTIVQRLTLHDFSAFDRK